MGRGLFYRKQSPGHNAGISPGPGHRRVLDPDLRSQQERCEDSQQDEQGQECNKDIAIRDVGIAGNDSGVNDATRVGFPGVRGVRNEVLPHDQESEGSEPGQAGTHQVLPPVPQARGA